MDRPHVATAEVEITAPAERVWQALVSPDAIKSYMFGTTVTTDWREGSPISWAGEWEGRPYVDQGEILRFDPPATLRYSHRSGTAEPGDDHVITVTLAEQAGVTRVVLVQDNNADDAAVAHSERNWNAMLQALRDHVEQPPSVG